MKTALSIPDELFSEAEALARRMKKSRSRLYADAVREYVARHNPDAVTAALNRACEEVAASECAADPALSAAATRLLHSVEW